MLRVESTFALHSLESRRGHIGIDALHDQADELREKYPDLDVEVRVVNGHPAQAMIQASGAALLTVLGTRGAQGMRGRLFGGNAPEVITFARGPLVVVPQWAREGQAGPVVVGLDELSPNALDVLDIALDEAAAVGSWVRAVHVLKVATAQDRTDAQIVAARDLEKLRSLELELLVRPARERHPDVPLEVKVLHSMPARALVEASTGSSLVVLAHRGGPGLEGWMRTSTSRRVAVAAACPVMIIRAPSLSGNAAAVAR